MRGCYPPTLRRALGELPETLDATYERILLGIDKAKRGYASFLFQCIAVSIRPFRVEELSEVLAASVLLDTGEDSEYHVDWLPKDAKQAVLSTCSSLITITNVDDSAVVQFSHFSVKEFLTSSRLATAGMHLSRYHILPHPSHAILARACLNVLLNLGQKVDRNVVERHPLAIYAARHWVDHAKFEAVTPSVQDLMERLFDPSEPYFAAWVWLYDVDRPWEGHMSSLRPTQPKATPLYYAALCGFRDLVESLAIKHPRDVIATGGSYDTPFHASLAKKEVDTALVLLKRGANINSLDYGGRSPLHAASLSGHCEVVKFLLEHQAVVDIQEKHTPTTPSCLAAKYGEQEICRLLLKHGANLELPSSDGWTPLHSAAWNGHPGMVQELLVHGADVNVRNADERTPLDFASRCGNLEVVRLLIGHGADVDCRDKQGWAPLHTAARHGHLDIVRLLLDLGTDVHSRNGKKNTPLILASYGGHVEVSAFLIERRADVNSINNGGWTALHSASQSGHGDVVKLLIDHGTDVNVPKSDLWVSLHLASSHGHLEVVELLIDRGAHVEVRNEDHESPLNLASGKGELEIARRLIECGSNVNSQDCRGWTPSHLAAWNGYLDVVGLLIDSGADIGIRDRNDKTPFDLALENGKRDVVSFLAKHEDLPGSQCGHAVPFPSLDAKSRQNHLQVEIVEPQVAGIKSPEDEESTSLHNALTNGRISMVQRLLDCGANVDVQDDLLQTPLNVASENGKLDLAKILINYGADVNSRNTAGWTPLHSAARFGRIDIARLLLDNGADINAMQRNCQTPLHIASGNEHLHFVQLLLERGANIHLRNVYGRTPSQEASTRGHRAIVQLLSE